LSLAEEQNAFVALETRTICRGHVVLALSLAKLDHRNVVLRDEGIDLSQKRVGHDAHQRRGSHRLAAMKAEEASGLLLRLEFRLIDIEVHPIDAFDFQGDVIVDDVGNAAGYTHDWLRSTKVRRTTTALSGQTLGLRKQTPPIDRSLSIDAKTNHVSLV